MSTLEQTQVGKLVLEQPRRARVFEEFGIDYCCGGQVTLAEACRRAGQAPESLLAALAKLDDGSPPTPAAQLTLRELCDHIVDTHHNYLYEALPRLQQLLQKVYAVHGDKHPELAQLQPLLASLRSDLETHMAKEEHVLFPMIRQMEADASLAGLHCGSVRGPIRVMEFEHEEAGAALRRMRELTQGYSAPPDACTSYQLLYHGLVELEFDLHEHIHKENNLLHPRAAALETALDGAVERRG